MGMSVSEITGERYFDEDCVFFRNPKQSCWYMLNGAKLVDLVATDGLQFVWVFDKESHMRLRDEWRTRKHD